MKIAFFSALALTFAVPAMGIAQDGLSGNWDYIGVANDGTTYFGEIKTKLGNQVVLRIRIVDDPESKSKDYVITNGIKCRERMVKQSKDWKKPQSNSVWNMWINFACK